MTASINASASQSASLPRYRRASQMAPPLLVQERDLAILQDLWRYRWLTTSQIEILRVSDPQATRRFTSRLPLTRRLKLLFHHCYVGRIARPLDKGSREPVYLLDQEGARILRARLDTASGNDLAGEYAEGGEAGERITARAPSRRPKTAALDHLLDVSQFRVSLVAAARTQGLGPPAWHSGHSVKFSVVLSERGRPIRSVRLIPDGFFALDAAVGSAGSPAGRRLFYFVEVDRGTEPRRELLAKCRAYYAYWQSGGFGTDFSVPPQIGFRVLFVLPSPPRAATLDQALRALPAGHTMFWNTTREQIMPQRVLSPVFRDGASGALSSLRG